MFDMTSGAIRKSSSLRCVAGFAAAAIAGLASLSAAQADEANAKNLVKAMSDYLAAQQAISFSYNSNLEIVTKEKQKLGLASSGALTLNRPDKLYVTLNRRVR